MTLVSSNGRKLSHRFLALLLVLLSVLAASPIWLWSISRIVQDRQRAAQNQRLYTAVEFDGRNYLGRRPPSIPWYRKLMGDKVYSYVQINDAATDNEWVTADRLFPEALVSRTPNPFQFDPTEKFNRRLREKLAR